MNYQQAYGYVESLSGVGIIPGLERIRELCKRLGDPQNELRIIHVAGTNGKGSTASYTASVLKCAGYKTGLFVSPAVRDYREKFRIGNRMISQKKYAEIMEDVKAACDDMVSNGFEQPTPFEVETALAFVFFAREACDFVVLECGMGGQMDSTNVVENTLVEMITSVGMDHMKFLGNSVKEIAKQKAGIIKPGSTIICMEQCGEVLEVVRQIACERGAGFELSSESEATDIHYGLEKQSFRLENLGRLEIHLAGEFQIANAILAVNACRELVKRGYAIPEKAIREGLAETIWPGRLTVIGKKPLFVIDGAHNEDAARKLAKSIEIYFTNKRIIYIIGVLKDKDYGRIIELTAKYADQIITVTPPENPRALEALDLAKEIAKVHPAVTVSSSPEEAVEMAKLLAGKEDVILAFGSLSYLGRLMDIMEYDKKKAPCGRGRGKKNG